jgi:hypothetical protein
VGVRHRSTEADEDGGDLLGDFFHLFIFLIRRLLCGKNNILGFFYKMMNAS